MPATSLFTCQHSSPENSMLGWYLQCKRDNILLLCHW